VLGETTGAIDSCCAGPRLSDRWHLDEMVVRIAGKRMYLWRAVDHEGEVLDTLVQSRRDSRAALRLMRKLLRKQGFVPKCGALRPPSMPRITDGLRRSGTDGSQTHR